MARGTRHEAQKEASAASGGPLFPSPPFTGETAREGKRNPGTLRNSSRRRPVESAAGDLPGVSKWGLRTGAEGKEEK